MNNLRFLLVFFIFAFASDQPRKCCKARIAKCLACLEDVSIREFCSLKPETPGCAQEKQTQKAELGGWSQYADDVEAKWEEILGIGVIDVEGFASDDLAALGAPDEAWTQVTAGTSYKFSFSDGTKVMVLEQLWMDPKIRITDVRKRDFVAEICDESPRQFCRMLCPKPKCKSKNQCALRVGNCCKFECVDSSSPTERKLDQGPGSWSTFEGDFVSKWSELLTKATIKVDGYASEDLVALGTPESASSQVVAGTNYKFAFSDGTRVTVLEQVWMDPQVTITDIDMPRLLSKIMPADLPAFGGWSAYEGDLKAKWSDILDKGKIDVDGLAFEDLAELGVPQSASSQVVAGTNYKFAFTDGTRVTVLEQLWMDPQIRITSIEVKRMEAKICPGSPQQLCRMRCPKPTCESENQCAFRKGKCCDFECIDPNAKEIKFAKEGEKCEGFNESTGQQFPKCEEGLTCKSTAQISIPGAGKTCMKSKDVKESEPKSCTLEDGEVVKSGWNGNGRGDNFCNKCGCHDGLYYCTEMFCLPIEIEPVTECICPVGRRELMINPDYFACEVEGYELKMETSKYQCPDGTEIDCGGPGYICQNADGNIMDTIDAEISLECPQDPPKGFGEKCAGDARCEYGEECCCGNCYPSEVYMCADGEWVSYFTDACMMPECELPIPQPKNEIDDIKCCAKDVPQGWDEGGVCCSDGAWHADIGDGSTTCDDFGLEDSGRCSSSQIQCCEDEIPQGWFEGGVCCADGQWHPDKGDGSTTCRDFGLSKSHRCPSQPSSGLILNATSSVPKSRTMTYVICVLLSIVLGVVAAILYRSYCCTKIENTDFYTDLKADV